MPINLNLPKKAGLFIAGTDTGVGYIPAHQVILEHSLPGLGEFIFHFIDNKYFKKIGFFLDLALLLNDNLYSDCKWPPDSDPPVRGSRSFYLM
jgi:hypothetical protein